MWIYVIILFFLLLADNYQFAMQLIARKDTYIYQYVQKFNQFL